MCWLSSIYFDIFHTSMAHKGFLDYQDQWGYKWRSSVRFIMLTVMMATLSASFLYGFIVPILPYMLEQRMQIHHTKTQRFISTLLAEGSFVSIIVSPGIGYLADQLSSKKILLISSIVASFLSTIFLALAESVYVLFIARSFQAAADNAMWVVSLATIAENVPSRHMAKTMGIVNVAGCLGISLGPTVSGILLESAGYWASWSSAFGLLGIDLVLRFLMIERPKDNGSKSESTSQTNSTNNYTKNSCRSPSPTLDNERTPLISSADTPSSLPDDSSSKPQNEPKVGVEYYTHMLSQRRFNAGLLCNMAHSILLTSFDTTLPLHARDTFQWSSGVIGLLFLGLQVPAVVLNPFGGWLKGRVGNRYPTSVAFLLLLPVLCLIGIPGSPLFAWTSGESSQYRALYIASIWMAGSLMSMVDGSAVTEVSLSVQDVERDHPGIFGGSSGQSRAMSLVVISWTLGSILGPILSGLIVENFGYFEMNATLGILCIFFSLNSFFNFGRIET
ncbi:putative MFS multidrug transporter [Talaromyces proteolyticus]|uniref:MFS multidrug transporter n=1 Tax=Talaromyces proteolyticus TaxID=1131652 RepID=A0AAD4L4I1_9EURO|nr:putative MFS multidrug transporter [Talaromyces proteolyticus]KAH8704866.1 putative MFS multidrug transporter [Talaromyces proteolyticus]